VNREESEMADSQRISVAKSEIKPSWQRDINVENESCAGNGSRQRISISENSS